MSKIDFHKKEWKLKFLFYINSIIYIFCIIYDLNKFIKYIKYFVSHKQQILTSILHCENRFWTFCKKRGKK
jgi:hypothetical protein